MKYSELPSHHALLLVSSDRKNIATGLFKELQSLSPAHRFFDQTVLDIDTARNIISWANTPYNEEKVAVVSFNTAGIPAQNALLKIIEEPQKNVRFIFVTSNKDHIIDTVLSRLQHVPIVNEENNLDIENAIAFLHTAHQDRMQMKYIVQLLAQKDEEDRKDREAVKAFILSLVEAEKESKLESRYFLETLEIASYASDPSASGKALLEYLALLLPQTKL